MEEVGVVHIGVGSKNPAKIAAVEAVAAKLFGDRWELHPSSVESGVPDQPMSADECIRGATNRANAARVVDGADYEYGIGLEGGLERIGDRWFACGWMVVVRRGSNGIGVGTSARFEVRGQVLKRLQDGEEMADVIDDISGEHDVRSRGGMMGVITNGHLARGECYAHGLLFAFGPWVSPKVYWE